MVLSLQSVYREELSLIATVKNRLPEVEIWLTDTDGRQAAMAQAMCLGADGLLGDDGLHRVAITAGAQTPTQVPASKRQGRSSRPRGNRNRAATASVARSGKMAPLLSVPPPPPGPVSPPTSTGTAPAPVRSERQKSPPNGGVVGPTKSSRAHFYEEDSGGEPVLTAEELRALLHDPHSEDEGRK